MANKPRGPTALDVVQLSVWAKPGKPVGVGHVGSVLLGETNVAGETLVTFTFDSRRMKRWLRREGNKFDKRHDGGQN